MTIILNFAKKSKIPTSVVSSMAAHFHQLRYSPALPIFFQKKKSLLFTHDLDDGRD